MTRLPVALAVVLSFVVVSAASAQMYPTNGTGMMPPGAMYPGMMPQGMPAGPAGHHAAMAAPPPMKLPPGVTAENGLLYYNGNAYADASYQQSPAYNPYQMAAYQANSLVPAGRGPMPAGMAQGASYNAAMRGGPGMSGYGGASSNYPSGYPSGEAYAGDCDVDGRPRRKASNFPGKVGYMWTAGYDALAMTRSPGSERVLVQNTNTLQNEFNAGQFDFNWEIGGRTHLDLMGPSGITYQGVYMLMAAWVADAEVNGNNDLQIPFPLAAFTVDYFGADRMQFHYTSQLQGAEGNILYPWGNFQLLGGYRWLNLDESIRLRSTDVIDGGTSDFTADCTNQLHGGQIGILGQWEMFGLINFDFMVKFGVFNNAGTEHQILRDIDNTSIVRDTVGTGSEVSYVTELGIQAVLPLGPIFSTHCGYDVLFIDRVALAPNQYDFTNTALSGTQVHQLGDIVVQGVNVGLTAHW